MNVNLKHNMDLKHYMNVNMHNLNMNLKHILVSWDYDDCVNVNLNIT